MNTFYARFENGDNVILDPASHSDCFFSKLPVVDQSETRSEFKRVNSRKACGPDGITPKLLKMCANELCFIYTYIFNLSLTFSEIPSIWKHSEIIPIPKKDKIIELNDLRPVALTSVPMKCFERIVLNKIKPYFSPLQDQLQFAYRARRSVEDAIVCFLDCIYKHLDKPRGYSRVLFVDFSSAFNTIKPNILLNKLNNFKINPYLVS